MLPPKLTSPPFTGIRTKPRSWKVLMQEQIPGANCVLLDDEYLVLKGVELLGKGNSAVAAWRDAYWTMNNCSPKGRTN